MPFTISPGEDIDVDRLFHIISDTFQHIQPILDAFFPQHDTPQGHIYGRDQILAQKHTDPNAYFIKAVDSGSNEIVGMAKWLILSEEVKVGDIDDAAGLRKSKEEREYVKELLEQYFPLRNEVIREAGGKKILVLDILAVDPKWQGRGAGSLLIKWGLDLAAELGVDTVVEASVAGRPVYEKCGFSVVKRMDFELSGRPEPHLYFMRCPAMKKR